MTYCVMVRFDNVTSLVVWICSGNKAFAELTEHYLCLMEHPPVYTVGLRGQQYSLDEERRLEALGADFHR